MRRYLVAAAVGVVMAMAGGARAAEVEVKMLNKGAEGLMVFEPALIKVAPGDSVKFVSTDKGHNAETIKGMLPDGGTTFVGKMGEDVAVKFDQAGIYGVKCAPHYGMGMVAMVVVGTPANEEQAKAVPQIGKAKQVFATLFEQARRQQDGGEVDKPHQRKKRGPLGRSSGSSKVNVMSIARLKDYRGPALFSYGFRPFFFFGSVYAGATILVWLPAFYGTLQLGTAFAPRDWHVHEMLFGYIAAVVAGFLLTAVPNWTGRLPLQGRPLVLLFSIWVAGRIAVSVSAWIGWGPAAASIRRS